jgi:TonB family protein
MRDVYEVLGEKKDAVERLRREVAALRSVAWLVDETTISNVPGQANVAMPAATDAVGRREEALRTAAPLLADETYEVADRIRALRISSAQTITGRKAEAKSRTVIETTRSQTIPTNRPLEYNGFRSSDAALVGPVHEQRVAKGVGSETSLASVCNSALVPSLFSLDEQGEEAKSGYKHGFVIAIVAILVIALAGYLTTRHEKIGGNVLSSNAAKVQHVANSAPTTPAGTQLNITRQPLAQGKSPSTKSPNPERMEEEPIQVKSDLRPRQAKAAAGDQISAPADAPAPLKVAGPADADDKISNLVGGTPFAPPNSEVLNISQGVTQGLIVKRVQPVYPLQALALRIEGSVLLKATIGVDGNITDVEAVSGPGVLGRAAVAAVRQWRYKPYFLDGKPVEIQTQITVNFTLAK